MTISFEAPYYNFIKHESVDNIEDYEKFLNFVKGEFDLFQKEEINGLKVYFPNGWFVVNLLNENERNIEFIINIKSKTLKSGKIIESKLKTLYIFFTSILAKNEKNLN